jgi:hypothetical protein
MDGATEDVSDAGSREWLPSVALIQAVVVTAIFWGGQGTASALAGLQGIRDQDQAPSQHLALIPGGFLRSAGPQRPSALRRGGCCTCGTRPVYP